MTPTETHSCIQHLVERAGYRRDGVWDEGYECTVCDAFLELEEVRDLERLSLCPRCDGDGGYFSADDNDNYIECPACAGSGFKPGVTW